MRFKWGWTATDGLAVSRTWSLTVIWVSSGILLCLGQSLPLWEMSGKVQDWSLEYPPRSDPDDFQGVLVEGGPLVASTSDTLAWLTSLVPIFFFLPFFFKHLLHSGEQDLLQCLLNSPPSSCSWCTWGDGREDIWQDPARCTWQLEPTLSD